MSVMKHATSATLVPIGLLLAFSPGALAQIPEGWELQTIAPAGTEYNYRDPDINDRGQVAFIRWKVPEHSLTEIFLYDRGRVTQLTDDEDRDVFPKINNLGVIAWKRDVDPDPTVEQIAIVRWRAGDWQTVIQDPSTNLIVIEDLNDVGQILWNKRVGDTPVDNLYVFDGVKSAPVAVNNLSNQLARLNKHGDIAWTKYNFFVGPWRSEIWARFAGSILRLANGARQLQLGGLSDAQDVTWWSPFTGVELWRDGAAETILAEDAISYGVNDDPTVTISRWNPLVRNHELWLWKNGELIQITDAKTGGLLGRINNRGEVAFVVGRLPSQGVSLLTKPLFRADLDFDGDVDLQDYSIFQRCYAAHPSTIDDECAAGDTNNDGEVNGTDTGTFVGFLEGPG